MPLPLATTTVSVYRPGVQTDGLPDVEPTYKRVANGVNAVISRVGGRNAGPTFERVILSARLLVDPLTQGGVQQRDVIVDETTGEQWDVEWMIHRLTDFTDFYVGQLVRRDDEVQAAVHTL